MKISQKVLGVYFFDSHCIIRLLLPPSTVSVALAQHTSSTSARRLQTSLVGHTSVLLNAATCWSLAPELSALEIRSLYIKRYINSHSLLFFFSLLFTRTELGRRSFPVVAPTVWNSLSAHLRSILISRRQFRDGLKSHLFADAYFWSSENIRYKSVMYLLTYLLNYYWFRHWYQPWSVIYHRSVFARLSVMFSCININCFKHRFDVILTQPAWSALDKIWHADTESHADANEGTRTKFFQTALFG